MRQLFIAVVFAAMQATTFAASAAGVPAYIGQRTSSPQDTAAIEQVVEEFKVALKARNARQLASLMHHPHILFESPMPPEKIREVREHNPHFNGLPVTGYRWFTNMIGNGKGSVEERFFNVKITQDGHVAWVVFDYDFVKDAKPQNHGFEVWQMMKNVAGDWRIISVFWTMNPPDNAGATAVAGTPAYIGKRTETQQDRAAIEGVIEGFKTAFRTRNTKQLSSLMLSDTIPFDAPASPDTVRRVRETSDPHFDGLPPGGFHRFIQLMWEKAKTEKRFFNVKITQDGHAALVTFDYDLLVDGKPNNHGVETWQMMKNAEGQWRIASAVWTTNPVK